MSAISLPKPMRPKSVHKMRPLDRQTSLTKQPTVSDQGSVASGIMAISPAMFWNTMIAFTALMVGVTLTCTAIYGIDGLTASWDAWNHWCAGGRYC